MAIIDSLRNDFGIIRKYLTWKILVHSAMMLLQLQNYQTYREERERELILRSTFLIAHKVKLGTT